MNGGIFIRMQESAEAARARVSSAAEPRPKRPAAWRARLAKAGISTLAGVVLATIAFTGGAVASVGADTSVSNSVAPAVVGATPESAGQGIAAFVDGAPTTQPQKSTALPSGTTTAEGSQVPLGGGEGYGYLSPEAAAERQAVSNWLLLNRWRDATANFQNKYDMWAIGDLMNAASRTMLQGNIMAIGNGFWTVSQWVADLAINLEPINLLGAQMDQIGATLGQAMLNPSSGVALIPLILIVVVGIWMFASWKKSGPGAGSMLFRRIAGLVATMAVFVVMVVGAQNSTTTAGGQYKPGVGSPGWLVTVANDSLSTAATVPVGAVLATVQTQTSGQIDADRSRAPGTANNNLCAETTNFYDKRFRESASPTVLAMPQVVLTQTMDAMWRTTGLPVWKSSQLGSSVYADYSYCRLLDTWTQTPSTNAYFFTLATGIQAGHSKESGQAAWTATSAEQLQRNMVAWAGCEPSDRGNSRWQWRSGWGQMDGVAADECQKWWDKKPGNDFEGGLSVGYTMNDVENKTANITPVYTKEQIQDYLASLNGANAAGNLFPLLMYAVSAFIMMFIFFGMAIAVVIAKLFVILGTITILPIMILALFRTNGLEQLGAAAKQFIGSMLFAALSLVLLSVVVLTTFILVQFGNGSFGAGSIMALSWAGAAPVLAVIALNMVFKKVLKMPSPMSMKGGLAYGLASGAAGGAVGGFLGARTARNAIERSSRQALQNAGSSALSKVSGGRFGSTMAERRASMGRGMLGPAGKGGKGALAGAAGAGKGVAAGAGAAGAAAAGAAAGGFLGSGKRAARQQARQDARRERIAARVFAAQQNTEARQAAGLPTDERGFRRLRTATTEGARNVWGATRRVAGERGAALWNGARTTARTFRHPIQRVRGDDLREQFTGEDGAFDEVGFRMARGDRLRADGKRLALGAAVVGGGVMTGGSSWVIGATAVGATYATAKATGAAWGVTKRVASNAAGQGRMAAYRNFVNEQAVAAQQEEQASRRSRRGGGGSLPPMGNGGRPPGGGFNPPNGGGNPPFGGDDNPPFDGGTPPFGGGGPVPPRPRTPVTGAPVGGSRPPLPPAPASGGNPFATVAENPRVLFDGRLGPAMDSTMSPTQVPSNAGPRPQFANPAPMDAPSFQPSAPSAPVPTPVVVPLPSGPAATPAATPRQRSSQTPAAQQPAAAPVATPRSQPVAAPQAAGPRPTWSGQEASQPVAAPVQQPVAAPAQQPQAPRASAPAPTAQPAPAQAPVVTPRSQPVASTPAGPRPTWGGQAPAAQPAPAQAQPVAQPAAQPSQAPAQPRSNPRGQRPAAPATVVDPQSVAPSTLVSTPQQATASPAVGPRPAWSGAAPAASPAPRTQQPAAQPPVAQPRVAPQAQPSAPLSQRSVSTGQRPQWGTPAPAPERAPEPARRAVETPTAAETPKPSEPIAPREPRRIVTDQPGVGPTPRSSFNRP